MAYIATSTEFELQFALSASILSAVNRQSWQL